ncbi:MAG TPA: hypothetical protein VNC84_05735 [Gammaproteobacteria bacterium]|nr:hypothetical protein [Gammaproteobacteria bacterium]
MAATRQHKTSTDKKNTTAFGIDLQDPHEFPPIGSNPHHLEARDSSPPIDTSETRLFRVPSFDIPFAGHASPFNTLTGHLNDHAGVYATQSIVGRGGVGKTWLVLQYIRMMYALTAEDQARFITPISTYSYILWFDGNHDLLTQFQGAAEAFLEKAEYDPEDVVSSVYAFLQKHHTLIVFDNIKIQRTLQRFLPSQDHHHASLHLILTSRAPHHLFLNPIRIDRFSPVETYGFLEHTFSEKQDQLAMIAARKHLLGIPFSLGLLSAYIKATNISLQNYLLLYQSKANEFNHHHLLVCDEFLQPIMIPLCLSLHQAHEENKYVYNLLGLSAYLAADCIPVDLLAKASQLPTEEARAAVDVLVRYGLLMPCDDPDYVSVHHLTQEIVPRYFADSPTWAEHLKQLILVLDKSLDDLTEKVTTSRHFKHVISCANAIISEHTHMPYVAKLKEFLMDRTLVNADTTSRDLTYHKEAEKLLRRMLRVIETENCSDMLLEKGTIMLSLAFICHDLQQSKEALGCATHALPLFKAVFDAEHPEIKKATQLINKLKPARQPAASTRTGPLPPRLFETTRAQVATQRNPYAGPTVRRTTN